MTSAQLHDFATRYAAAWCSRNPVSVAVFYSPNASITVNGGAPTPILEVARSFMDAFPDMQVLFDRLEIADGHTDFHWTLIGTNTGPGGTGAKVVIGGFERWTISADGLIASSEGHFDPVEYARQLALV